MAVKKPIDDLDEVEKWTRTHLDTSAAAALRVCPGWTYRPIRWGLRCPRAMIVPHPDRLTTHDEAARWAAVAQDLAVESRELSTPAVGMIGAAFAIITACLGFGLSRITGPVFTGLESVTVVVLVALGVGPAAHVVRPIHDAVAWEHRAAALRARAEELAASRRAAREAVTRRVTVWPWQRTSRYQARQG